MNLYVQQRDLTTNHRLLLLELPTFARATAPHSYHIEQLLHNKTPHDNFTLKKLSFFKIN